MSLRLSYPERTNLYLTNLNNKSKIEIFIPDGVLKCDESYEEFYINVIQFNTFHNFYNVIQDYNNNFNIIIDNDTIINCSIPEGNINAFTIREYINNHTILKNHIYVVYDKFKSTFEYQKISNSSLQLQIINAHSLLGFSRDKRLIPILLPHDENIYSEQPINVISITNFFVHASGDLYLNDDNFDNHKSSEITNNDIIFSMAIDKPFNHCLSYNNSDGGNSFYYRLDNSKAKYKSF